MGEMYRLSQERLGFDQAYLIEFSADYEDALIFSSYIVNESIPCCPGMKVKAAVLPMAKTLIDQKQPIACENIENILNIYEDKEEIQHVSKLVPNDEISKEDYNLSVSTYVEIEDTREKIDIKLLNKEIEEIVTRQDELRKAIDEIVAEIEVE